jgi:peptidoglycan-N-acetylglucosamine deacetylase
MVIRQYFGNIAKKPAAVMSALIISFCCFLLHKSFAQGATFGSQTVLDNCWTPGQLKGSPEDKKIRKRVFSDQTEACGEIPTIRNSPLPKELENSIRYVIPFDNRKIAALTFDLCELKNEITGYDAEIVNYLREHQVKATFFAGGKWMYSHPEKTMQLMADPLFEIGNHAWTHGNLRILKEEKIREQILRTQAQYELLRNSLSEKTRIRNLDAGEMRKIPSAIRVFRFPYGTCSPAALRILAEYGLPAIQWDVVSGDAAKNQTAQEICRIVLSQTRPGSVIICHANGRGHGTALSLQTFIPKLREQGYNFVTVSELLDMGRVISVKECYELNPGDNYQYDRMFREGADK